MAWFNVYGFIFMIIMMIPNMVYGIKCKEGFLNLWENKLVETFEQIGRFGCFGMMVINIPGTCFGFPSDEAFAIYLVGDAILLFCYCLIWVVCFRQNSIFRALTLSILPSVLFLFSGIVSRSVLLILAAVIFAPCHILISYKNAAAEREQL